tara:strand:+ start:24931 stop:25719 length:789 start_codon:yes stop_codon:yes gene_type:complete
MEKFLKRIKLILFFLSTLPNARRNKVSNSHTLIVTSYSKELVSQIDRFSEKLTDILFVNRSLYEFLNNEENNLIKKIKEKYKISIFLGDPIWFKEENWLERHKQTWEILRKDPFINLIIPYQFSYLPKKYSYSGIVSLINLDKFFLRASLPIYLKFFPILPIPCIHNSGLISILISSHHSKYIYVSGFKLNYTESIFPCKDGKVIQKFNYQDHQEQVKLNQSYSQRIKHISELLMQAEQIVKYIQKSKKIIFLTKGCTLGWN